MNVMKYYCIICDKPVDNYIPRFCCSGRDCSCQGLPIEPPICSKECLSNFLINKEIEEIFKR
ncbi:MAG: hypothetical protein ACFFDY_01185 [Candidatus Thorarchaeota archaeon]